MEHGSAAKVSEIEIIYEDDDVLVVNKPSGLLVHADRGEAGDTVVEWFLARAPLARGVGEPAHGRDGTLLERSGVVHRLDRETSGVLVLAKTQDAFVHLKQQFQDRLVQKEYRAFVYGTMKEQWGTIERTIGRSTKNFRLRSAQRGAKGMMRDAVTNWELIAQKDGFAYLRLLPKTGRMHQIRVHLKAINHPVLKDELYASPNLETGPSLGFDRLALHAYRLTLTLPKGEERSFEAPLGEEFLAAERALAV